MAEVLTLTVDTPAEDDTPLATGAGGSPAQSSPRDSEEVMSSGEEQSAAAALLGLHAAWPSSPDDEGADDDTQEATCYPYDAGADHWDTSAAAHRMMYDSGERDDYSPKNLRTVLDYDTPGNPSPKRMRAPKDGARRPPPRAHADARPARPSVRPSAGSRPGENIR